MNSKVAAGIAVLVVLMMGAVAVGTNWEDLGFQTDTPGGENEDKVPFIPGDDDKIYEDGKVVGYKSLNGTLFEQYGALMLVIGALMFGAMIAGVCISREEEDSDD